MHVRHRDDRNAADLKAALRAAEAAVKEKLDYTIALTEKPLFAQQRRPDPDHGSHRQRRTHCNG